MKKRVVIFGAGRNLESLLTEPVPEMQIVGILDNDTSKQGKEIDNIKIYAPQTLNELDYEEIIVSVSYPRFLITKQLMELGAAQQKISFYVGDNEPLKSVGISEYGSIVCTMKYSRENLEWTTQWDEDLSWKIFKHSCMRTLEVSSYLALNGWFNSVNETKPINYQGEEIPWITYPTIDFMEEKNFANKKIFEYGCGNSTIYWTAKNAEVVSVEHDLKWYKQMKLKLRGTKTKIYYCELSYGGGYSEFASNYKKHYFDMVVIDGRDRVNCCRHAVDALNDHGVILFDDSNRDGYKDGYSFLRMNGFRELPFWGMVPELSMKSKTSIFYRSNNWLEI